MNMGLLFMGGVFEYISQFILMDTDPNTRLYANIDPDTRPLCTTWSKYKHLGLKIV